MEQSSSWVFFEKIDWNCPNHNFFHLDTRDFHCSYQWNDEPRKDLATLRKYPNFFFTADELIEMLRRFYIESGGKKEWRFFMIDGKKDWSLKYIRIARTELGFVVADSNMRAIRKELINVPVIKDKW